MYGSDQAASLEPRGMRELVSSLTIMIKAFGQEKLGFVTAEEEIVAKKLRAHIKH
jgi:hypothetical protein